MRTGETMLEDIPVPVVIPGHILVKTHCSLVSSGTERMLVEFSKAGILAKARKQPERVQQVLDKMRTEGILPTLSNIFRRLDEPLPLGYCNAGEVVAVGPDVDAFKVGDRVISNGPHAEYALVPEQLAAKMPGQLPYEDAVFTVLGAVALQGIRLISPQLGETVVVTGLGIVGLLASQLLRANGCRVLATDISETRLAFARGLGIDTCNGTVTEVGSAVRALTEGHGSDAVLITASAPAERLLDDAAELCRQRGRIVLTGVVDTKFKRDTFYRKELQFQVSCSYGPGRYDRDYEEKGIDYPLEYVRWTAKRNFDAVLHALECGDLHVRPLVSGIYPLSAFEEVYAKLDDPSVIAALFTYPETVVEIPESLSPEAVHYKKGNVVAAVIGAGNYVKMTMLPALQEAHIPVKYIADAHGLHAAMLAKKYAIPYAVTGHEKIWKDPDVNWVLIATRHDTHYPLVEEALLSGKNVFTEKPLLIDRSSFDSLLALYKEGKALPLSVGYNRRFAPLAIKAKSYLDPHVPLNCSITVNAGYLPPGSWQLDMEHGGRVAGEACHFIDLAQYFAGSRIARVLANAQGIQDAIILLQFVNGSQAAIHYFSNGATSYPKERIELFSGNKTIVIDQFRKLYVYGKGRPQTFADRSGKGHQQQFTLIAACIERGESLPVPIADLINSAEAVPAIRESVQQNSWITLGSASLR